MKCIYINLDREALRREQIEDNFASVPHRGWTLERHAAIDGSKPGVALPPGPRRNSEKACILSHASARQLAAAQPAPTLIVEDDCRFGHQTFALLDQLLATRQPDSWDMLYTDVGVPNPEDMLKLFRLRRRLSTGPQGRGFSGQLQLVDLKTINFVGSAACIFTPQCAARLAQTVASLTSLDAPDDMLLRHLVKSGQTRAMVTFPFLTTQSTQAELSANQPESEWLTDFLWNSFRRLMWVEAEPAAVAAQLRQAIPADHVDEQAAAFREILGACLSSRFVSK